MLQIAQQTNALNKKPPTRRCTHAVAMLSKIFGFSLSATISNNTVVHLSPVIFRFYFLSVAFSDHSGLSASLCGFLLNFGNYMQQTIQQLNPRHYKILEYCLCGMTNTQIATQLGMTQPGVSVITNSPNFQHELATRRSRLNAMTDERLVSVTDDIASTIRDGARAAITKVLGSINSDNERIALSASQDILDRAGFPRVSRVESKAISIVINAKDAALIAESLELDNSVENTDCENIGFSEYESGRAETTEQQCEPLTAGKPTSPSSDLLSSSDYANPTINRLVCTSGGEQSEHYGSIE